MIKTKQFKRTFRILGASALVLALLIANFPAISSAAPGDPVVSVDANGVITGISGIEGNLVIPDGAKTMGEGVIPAGGKYTSITIPASFGSLDNLIGNDNFLSNTSLGAIVVKEGNTGYASDENGVLYSYNATDKRYTLLKVPAAKSGYTFPEITPPAPDPEPEEPEQSGDGGGTNVSPQADEPEISHITVGPHAFRNCTFTAPAEITFPDVVDTIYNTAFLGSNISAAHFGAGNPAFIRSTDGAIYENRTIDGGNVKVLKVVLPGVGGPNFTVPSDVNIIEDGAFDSNSKITNLVMDDSIAGDYSSVNGDVLNKAKTNLIKVLPSKTGVYAIPAGVATISDFAFNNTNVTEVNLPKNLATGALKTTLFDGSKISAISVGDDNIGDSYISVDGILYNKEGTGMMIYPPEKRSIASIPTTLANFVIPAQVSDITADLSRVITFSSYSPSYPSDSSGNFLYTNSDFTDLFKISSNLKGTEANPVEIPSTVKFIYDRAFTPNGPAFITIHNGVETMGDIALIGTEASPITIIGPKYLSTGDVTVPYKWWVDRITNFITFQQTDDEPDPEYPDTGVDYTDSNITHKEYITLDSLVYDNLSEAWLRVETSTAANWTSEGRDLSPADKNTTRWYYDITLNSVSGTKLNDVYFDSMTVTIPLDARMNRNEGTFSVYTHDAFGMVENLNYDNVYVEDRDNFSLVTFTTKHCSQFVIEYVYKGSSPTGLEISISDSRKNGFSDPAAATAKTRISPYTADGIYSLIVGDSTDVRLSSVLHPAAAKVPISLRLIEAAGQGADVPLSRIGENKDISITLAVPDLIPATNAWNLNPDVGTVVLYYLSGNTLNPTSADLRSFTISAVDQNLRTITFNPPEGMTMLPGEAILVYIPKALQIVRDSGADPAAVNGYITTLPAEGGAYLTITAQTKNDNFAKTSLKQMLDKGAKALYYNVTLKNVRNEDIDFKTVGEAGLRLAVPPISGSDWDFTKGTVSVYTYTMEGGIPLLGTYPVLSEPIELSPPLTSNDYRSAIFALKDTLGDYAIVFQPNVSTVTVDGGRTDITVSLTKDGAYVLKVAENITSSTLSPLLTAEMTEGETASYYDISLVTADTGVPVTDFGSATIKVPLPQSFDLTKGSVKNYMYTVDANGRLEALPATVDTAGKSITFTTTHFSEFGVVLMPLGDNPNNNGNGNENGNNENNNNNNNNGNNNSNGNGGNEPVNVTIQMPDGTTYAVPGKGGTYALTTGGGVINKYVDMPKTSDQSPVRTIAVTILVLAGIIMLLMTIPVGPKKSRNKR